MIVYLSEIYDTYELEVKNVFGFEQSSAILSCEISPPSASSFVQVIGWTEKIDDKITSIDLRKLISNDRRQQIFIDECSRRTHTI